MWYKTGGRSSAIYNACFVVSSMLREATTNSSGHAKCVLLARVNEVGLPPQKKKIFFFGGGGHRHGRVEESPYASAARIRLPSARQWDMWAVTVACSSGTALPGQRLAPLSGRVSAGSPEGNWSYHRICKALSMCMGTKLEIVCHTAHAG